MAQNQQIGLLGQYLTVNTSANSIVFNTNMGLQVNGSLGTAGQILTSNGTGSYWSSGAVGYTGSIGAGYTGSIGSVGYAGSSGVGYTGSGASGGGGGFSNGQSIMVSNTAYSNTSNTSAVYTFYNTTTKSLDTVFI